MGAKVRNFRHIWYCLIRKSLRSMFFEGLNVLLFCCKWQFWCVCSKKKHHFYFPISKANSSSLVIDSLTILTNSSLLKSF